MIHNRKKTESNGQNNQLPENNDDGPGPKVDPTESSQFGYGLEL